MIQTTTSFLIKKTETVRIEEKINGPMSVLSGVINTTGMMRTRINWTLTLEDQKMTVPLLAENKFHDFLERHNFIDEGAYLLIKMNDLIEEVNLDAQYTDRFFLDENFEISEEAKYIFYAGVSPGNCLIKYATMDKKIAEKVVFLGEGEIFFDNVDFWASGLERISLLEKRLMGRYQSELVIDGDKISYFNRENIKARIAGTNRYEYKRPTLPMGMRQYLKLSHLPGVFFVGNWHKQRLEVPSESFIDEVFRNFDLQELFGRCLIQLNFSKDIMRVKAEGLTTRGVMNIKTLVLEKDGTMTSEITNNVEKVFFLGDEQGIINTKIDYVDNSVDFLQTYCSNDSYLLEQL